MHALTMASAVRGEAIEGSKDLSGHALHIDEFGDEELVGRTGQLSSFAELDIALGPESVLVVEMQDQFRNTGQDQSAKNAVVRNRAASHNFGRFRAVTNAVRFLSFGVMSVHRYGCTGFAGEAEDVESHVAVMSVTTGAFFERKRFRRG